MTPLKLAFFLLIAFALAGIAQEYPRMESWMQTNQSASDTLGKLDSKTGPQAVSAAEDLGGVYENMISFWRQRSAVDATRYSEQGKAAAVELASAANAGDAAAAASAYKQLASTCQACHQAHRERLPGGGFTVK